MHDLLRALTPAASDIAKDVDGFSPINPDVKQGLGLTP
jgi:hypothetical protein